MLRCPSSANYSDIKSGCVVHTQLRKPPQILPTWCSSQEFLVKNENVVLIEPTSFKLVINRKLHAANNRTAALPEKSTPSSELHLKKLRLDGHKIAVMVEKAGRDVTQEFNAIRRIGHCIC